VNHITDDIGVGESALLTSGSILDSIATSGLWKFHLNAESFMPVVMVQIYKC